MCIAMVIDLLCMSAVVITFTLTHRPGLRDYHQVMMLKDGHPSIQFKDLRGLKVTVMSRWGC